MGLAGLSTHRTQPSAEHRDIVPDAAKRVVFASGNQGKLREVAEMFSDPDLLIVAQSEFGIEPIDETGSTFVQNALLKARHAAAVSGLPSIADDSGLSVDVLDGWPGVKSARFAGDDASDDDNITKLLAELDGVPGPQRTAAFHCAAVYVDPDRSDDAVIAEGVWHGMILQQRDGTGGFGYDPVFFDSAAGKSGANMTAAEKNAVSHRGSAFRQLVSLLRDSELKP